MRVDPPIGLIKLIDDFTRELQDIFVSGLPMQRGRIRILIFPDGRLHYRAAGEYLVEGRGASKLNAAICDGCSPALSRPLARAGG